MKLILTIFLFSSTLLSAQRQRDQKEQFRDKNLFFLRDSINNTYEIISSNSNGSSTTVRYVDSTIVDVIEKSDFHREFLYENERIYNDKFLSNKRNRSVIIEYKPDIARNRRHFYKISSARKGLIYGSSITYWKNEKDKNYLLANYELIVERTLADSIVKLNDTTTITYPRSTVLLIKDPDRFEGMNICKDWKSSPLPDKDTQTLKRKLKNEFAIIPYNYSKRRFNRKLKKLDSLAFAIYKRNIHLVLVE